MKNIRFLTALLLAFLFFAGCTSSLYVIRMNPQDYSGETVVLMGEIKEVLNIPFTGGSIFVFGNAEEEVTVFSAKSHEKSGFFMLKGMVVAFPADNSEMGNDKMVDSIAGFLVKYKIASEKDARGAARGIGDALKAAARGLGNLYFILEEE